MKWNAQEIIAVLTGVAGIITAITALIHSIQTRSKVKNGSVKPPA